MVRLKLSPIMGWHAGAAISVIPSFLSARHGVIPVGAVLYRHRLPAALQFTGGKQGKAAARRRAKEALPRPPSRHFGASWLARACIHRGAGEAWEERSHSWEEKRWGREDGGQADVDSCSRPRGGV